MTDRPTFISVADLDNRFTYHPPTPEQIPVYEDMRSRARALAIFIVANTPPSREQSLAITHLEDAVMWANASIARAPRTPVPYGSDAGPPPDLPDRPNPDYMRPPT